MPVASVGHERPGGHRPVHAIPELGWRPGSRAGSRQTTFDVERLMRFLPLLNQDVEILKGPRSDSGLSESLPWHSPPCKPRRINKFQARNPFQLPLLHPSSCCPKNSDRQSQRIVSAESITYVSYSAPALYTVDRSESAVVLIRTWLCSASRVQQPHRPVSGIPASPAANRRVLASFRPPCGRVPAHSHAGPPPQRYPIEIRTLTQRNPNHRTLRTVRETHLAKKTPKMRLPMSSQHRNQLKQNGLKVHD
jgi:hypothetical protein